MSDAQPRQEPGRKIGSVSTLGNLVVLTLDQGALGKQNLFDLDHRTIRFTPEGTAYRAENTPLAWDADSGSELTSLQTELHNFAFPFSGRTWTSLSIGVTGSIRFGAGGPVTLGRFDQLQKAARGLVNTVPAICVFLKPRMSGHVYMNELPDRVIITWDLTEPHGGIQDFTWTPTINRFQAVLRRDGAIDLSYNQVARSSVFFQSHQKPTPRWISQP